MGEAGFSLEWHQLFMSVCIPISYISRGRQRLCPQGLGIHTRGQQGSQDRDRVPGMEQEPPWPWAGTGMAPWGAGMGTVCCHIQPCRNVCCCEGGKAEVKVKIRFEHRGDGAFKESISTQQNTWDVPTLASNKSCCLGWGLGISFFCFSDQANAVKTLWAWNQGEQSQSCSIFHICSQRLVGKTVTKELWDRIIWIESYKW